MTIAYPSRKPVAGATGLADTDCPRLIFARVSTIGAAVGSIIASIITVHIPNVIARSVPLHARGCASIAPWAAWPVSPDNKIV